MFTLTEPPVQHRLSAVDDNYIELGKIDLNKYFITEHANQWIFKSQEMPWYLI